MITYSLVAPDRKVHRISDLRKFAKNLKLSYEMLLTSDGKPLTENNMSCVLRGMHILPNEQSKVPTYLISKFKNTINWSCEKLK